MAYGQKSIYYSGRQLIKSLTRIFSVFSVCSVDKNFCVFCDFCVTLKKICENPCNPCAALKKEGNIISNNKTSGRNGISAGWNIADGVSTLRSCRCGFRSRLEGERIRGKPLVLSHQLRCVRSCDIPILSLHS